MGSMSGRKGKAYERAVEVWLEEAGHNTDRTMAGASVEDICIHELALSIEAKNQKAMNLAGWVDQAVRQVTERGGKWLPIVIHKRAGRTDVGEHYATMRVRDLIELIERLRQP